MFPLGFTIHWHSLYKLHPNSIKLIYYLINFEKIDIATIGSGLTKIITHKDITALLALTDQTQ